eukprot:CAMPEP_0171069702 /NCGR_PEP_ID=MMETSP0766_2-20121228/9313_1 /TAXON_ID=439317 /ORGANISM="Gambierdiscus australes, Strain CAWD 149" /LENGTH=175 /DNA_ID=CAMNT_0011526115 /DNA_START=6 /DNA_END=529 /DNA_ORIENTATION=+
MQRVKLIICDLDPGFCDAARAHFPATVEVIQESLEALLTTVDCVVWPGNSHALPASGLDAALTRLFGSAVLERVRAHVLSEFGHEGAPVGHAWLVPAARGYFVAYAVVFPRTHEGPRLGMHGALEAVAQHNCEVVAHQGVSIQRVACPGLGTFAGMRDVEAVAIMMAAGTGGDGS